MKVVGTLGLEVVPIVDKGKWDAATRGLGGEAERRVRGGGAGSADSQVGRTDFGGGGGGGGGPRVGSGFDDGPGNRPHGRPMGSSPMSFPSSPQFPRSASNVQRSWDDADFANFLEGEREQKRAKAASSQYWNRVKQGLYMTGMFGGREVFDAISSSARVSGANPREMAESNLKLVDQISGGFIGSWASMAIDPRGDSRLAVDRSLAYADRMDAFVSTSRDGISFDRTVREGSAVAMTSNKRDAALLKAGFDSQGVKDRIDKQYDAEQLARHEIAAAKREEKKADWNNLSPLDSVMPKTRKRAWDAWKAAEADEAALPNADATANKRRQQAKDGADATSIALRREYAAEDARANYANAMGSTSAFLRASNRPFESGANAKWGSMVEAMMKAPGEQRQGIFRRGLAEMGADFSDAVRGNTIQMAGLGYESSALQASLRGDDHAAGLARVRGEGAARLAAIPAGFLFNGVRGAVGGVNALAEKNYERNYGIAHDATINDLALRRDVSGMRARAKTYADDIAANAAEFGGGVMNNVRTLMSQGKLTEALLTGQAGLNGLASMSNQYMRGFKATSVESLSSLDLSGSAAEDPSATLKAIADSAADLAKNVSQILAKIGLQAAGA